MYKIVFEKIPTVLKGDELIDKAFSRANRAGRGKTVKVSAERSRIKTASNILSDNLKNIVRRFPNFDDLSLFYLNLADVVVGVDSLKISLASVQWASEKIHKLSYEHLSRIRDNKDIDPVIVRKQAFGRMASIIKEIDSDLKFLGEARNKMRKLPTVSDLPTIVVCGFPNVGKSSFMSKVSSGKPKIDTYPFTTKGISVGLIFRDDDRYQIIDTPGLFDRPLSKRNKIELLAILALKYLGDVILFIIDPTETCGYTLEEQLSLKDELKTELDIPMLVVTNKNDMADGINACEVVKEGSVSDMSMSSLTGENVEEVVSRLFEIILGP